MTINKYWSWELPEKIYGTAIVVDTFAAMTNLSIILSKKPRRLIIINGETLEKAKDIYPDGLVIGESVKGEKYNWQDIVDQITINLRLYYKAVRKDFESLELTLSKNKYNIVPAVYKKRILRS